MRIESNPFKVNYDLIEFTKNTIPEKEVIVGKDKKTTQRNREAHRAVVLDYVMNDPQGQDVYESLKKPNETELEFSERVAAKGQELFPVNEEPIKKGTSKGSSSGTSSSSKTKKPTVKVQSRDTDTLDNNGQPKYDQSLSYNKLLLDNTPPVYVVADDGTTRVKDWSEYVLFSLAADVALRISPSSRFILRIMFASIVSGSMPWERRSII